MAHAATIRRKQPRTFSLSQDVIEALECFKNERQVESLTSAVEEIVRDWKKTYLSGQVTAYYDSLSDEEIGQEKRWGEFSESQM
jgi:hypothetical protein